jgi:hypothetical protein
MENVNIATNPTIIRPIAVFLNRVESPRGTFEPHGVCPF